MIAFDSVRTVTCTIEVTDEDGERYDPDSIVVSVILPDGTVDVEEDDMTPLEKGLYNYTYTIEEDSLKGIYTFLYKSTYEGDMVTQTDYFLWSTALLLLAQAKAHLRVDGDDDDMLIMQLIEAATRIVEDYTGRAFVQRQVTEQRIGNGKTYLTLYKRPIVAESVSVTIDGEDVEDYETKAAIGRIVYGSGWPLDSEIEVLYTAGYAATAPEVQGMLPNVVIAVLMLLARLYENRIAGVTSQSVSGLGSVTFSQEQIPPEVKALINSLRVNVGLA